MRIPSLHNLSLHVPVSAPLDFERLEQNVKNILRVEKLARERERARQEQWRRLPQRAGDPEPFAEPGPPRAQLHFEAGGIRAVPR